MSSSDGSVLASLLHSVVGWRRQTNRFQSKAAGALVNDTSNILKPMRHVLMAATNDCH